LGIDPVVYTKANLGLLQLSAEARAS